MAVTITPPVLVSVSRTLFVDVNGGDVSGAIGRPDLPFLTISAANTAATAALPTSSSPIAIMVGPGTFNETSNLQLSSYVSLIGAGIDSTKIVTTYSNANRCGLVPGTNSYLSRFTFDSTSGGNNAIGCFTSDTAFTNAVLDKIKVLGQTDCIQFGNASSCSWKAYDCAFSSNNDVITASTTGPVLDFYSCSFTSDGAAGASTHAFGQTNVGTYKLYGCTLKSVNANPATENITVKNNGATVQIYNAVITRDATGTTVFDLKNTAGTLSISNIVRDDGAALTTSGTITDLATANPSGSVGLAAVNGTSSLYMRADAAPALSQAIAPTWTGQHTFSEARSITSATSAVLDDVNLSAQTTTITGTTAVTTAKGFNKVSIYQPTYTDSSSVTVTVGATLYIEDAPTTAGLLTLTNKYPLWVDNGTVRIDGGLTVGNTGVEAAGTINASSGYRTGGGAPTAGTILQSDGARFINTNIVWPSAGNIAGAVPVCNASNSYVAKVLGGLSSVTATVDQTATAETAHVIGTVKASTASIGTVFHIHASGNVDNGTTGITFTPHIRWGGTAGVSLLAIPTFTASTTANTNRAYVLDAYVTIRTIGATGTAVAEMNYVEKSTSTTGVETTHTDNSGTTAVTIDTTADKDLDLTWALSATTGTPHIRTISGFVSVIKP